jgi:hypothetical protein
MPKEEAAHQSILNYGKGGDEVHEIILSPLLKIFCTPSARWK